MGMRTYTYLFLFFSLPASAAIIGSQNSVVPPILVKAKTFDRSYTSGPAAILTRDEMNATGIVSLSQALQDLAGIQLQDLTGNSSQVMLGMRGFGANATSNTLMMLNGIPLTNPDLAPPDLNAIPLRDIEYVEVVAGSESVLYGDQAVGGVINVITREHPKENAAVFCDAGSFNLAECSLIWNHHMGRLQFDITGTTEHTDNYRDHNTYDQRLVLGKFFFPYTTGSLTFHYKLANEDMEYPGALTAEQVSENRRQANNDIDYFRDWSGFFHLKQKQILNASWQLETDIARRNMNGHGTLFSPFTQSRLIYFLKPQLKGIIAGTSITTGLDFQTDNYHLNSPYGLNDDTQQKYGLFALANYPYTNKLSFSAGARGAMLTSRLVSSNRLDLVNRAFATTLGGSYQYTHHLQFYLRRAESFRFPKADENNATPNGIIGLRTQRGVAYEAGTQLQEDTYSAKFNLYQLNLKDEIAFDPTQTPQDPFGSNRNLSPTIRRGFSLSGKDKLTNQLSLNGQYNFVSARFQNGVDAGDRIPLVSENILRGGVEYKLADFFSIYPEAVFTSNQYAANDDANIAGAIGGYTIYNFNLHYEKKNILASLRFNNIFNKYYYFYTVYQPSVDSEFFYPAPGRNFTLSLTYLFT